MSSTFDSQNKSRSQHRLICSALASLVAATTAVDAFQASCRPLVRSLRRQRSVPSSFDKLFPLYSSVGDGPPGPPPEDGDSDPDGLNDFFSPRDESENLKRAREFMSESSLPISFDMDATDQDDDENATEVPSDEDPMAGSDDSDTRDMVSETSEATSSAIVNVFGSSEGSAPLFAGGKGPSADVLAKNPYMQVVSKLTPSELISKFTSSASPRVQDAVRTTVLGLIGSLPKMAFDTTTITTGQRLASLMFQLQMTGYMLKNADYRLSLSQSLGVSGGVAYSTNLLLTGSETEEDEDEDPLTSGKVKGTIKVRYVSSNLFQSTDKSESDDDKDEESSSSNGVEIEVDAAAYMSELRSEVSKLKEELVQRTEEKEESIRKDLLLYIRTLPAQELRSLTDTMSPDVLVCMKGLVQAVLGGIGDGQIGPETVTEQSGEAMAQLCMWQLAVGYNLRELEVREEMKKSLENILEQGVEGGLDGTLE